MRTLRCRPARGRRSRHAPGHGASWLLVLAFGGVAMAESAGAETAREARRFDVRAVPIEAPCPDKPDSKPDRRGLDRGRLLPRVSFPLEQLSAFGQAGVPGHEIADHVLFDELSDAVYYGIKRTTRKAVKSYLIDMSDLDRKLGELKSRRRQAVEQVDPAGQPRKRLRFDFGISHFLPEVEMRYKLQGGSIKFSLDAEGAFDFSYRNTWMGRTEIRIGVDDGYRLQCRFGF